VKVISLCPVFAPARLDLILDVALEVMRENFPKAMGLDEIRAAVANRCAQQNIRCTTSATDQALAVALAGRQIKVWQNFPALYQIA
jgi:hypothetical protein